MAKYRFVILHADGNCQVLERCVHATPNQEPISGGTMRLPRLDDPAALLDPSTAAEDVIPRLLVAGWVPLRETAMGDGTALLVFEKPA